MKATDNQLAYMDAHGIEYPADITKAQATALITEYQYQKQLDPEFDDDRHPHDLD